MKNLFVLPVIFWLSPIIVLAATLMPSDNFVCKNFQTTRQILITCDENSEFYSDQNGRCGCLKQEEVIPTDICNVREIICDASHGLTYGTLLRDLNRCGPTQNVFVGCGCFTTES